MTHTATAIAPDTPSSRKYPSERKGAKTGPKSRYKAGSVNWTIRIPADPAQQEECKRLIRVILGRFE